MIELVGELLRKIPAITFPKGVVSVFLVTVVLATAATPALAKYAAIVVEAETGRVLYARNADTRNYPASLTKMMTLYMLFEALEEGRVSMKTRMKASRRAAGQPPSKLGLRVGDTISVENAIKVLVTKSANDVATVVAEHLGGTESKFAALMTKRARKLGMSRTTFRNASGLPNRGQLSTARDMATLAIALRRDFPQYYHFFSVTKVHWGGRTIRTHNRVLLDYEGADGLKTGYIRASGFNLATSVVRDGISIVGVVFGGKTARWRDRHMMALLDKGFSQVTQLASLPRPLRKPATLLTSAEDDGEQEPLLVGEGDATPPASLDVWGVQVGAFTAFTTASRQAARAVHVLRETAPDSQAAVMPVQADDGLVYRARVLGLENETAARAACARLRAAETGCVVVTPAEASVDVALNRDKRVAAQVQE